MVFFRRKSSDDDQSDDKAEQTFKPQPDKARKWFEHAKTMADSYNFESALAYYAHGIRLDPTAMSAHEAMHECALQYLSQNGKAASNKEIRSIDDGTPVGRFAAAEFAWMKDLGNLSLALKALEASSKAGQEEFGLWLAPKALNLVRRQTKKPNKSTLIKAKDLFSEVGAWDEAIAAGEMAVQADPNDNELIAELKDLAAQRAMDRGGYEEAGGKEGGFRRFIRDEDKQRQLEEEQAISGGATVEQRNLERARKAIEENPTDSDAINKYAQELRKQDTDEALQQAHEVYMQGFKNTGEYRFRMNAGDIEIQQLRRTEQALKEKLKNAPDDEQLKSEYEHKRRERLEKEEAEFRERAEKYPTDRFIKFRLGEIEFELGRYDEAMPSFQSAKDEPKLRVRASHMLGRCFAAEGWHSEAIAEFEEAINSLDVKDPERELPVCYDLMQSLTAEARSEKDMDLAKRAREMCSQIARRDITYRDIRQKRKEVEQLIKSLDSKEE